MDADNGSSSTRKHHNKMSLSSRLIVIGLIVLAVVIVFGPTTPKNINFDSSSSDIFREKSNRIGSEYQRCLEKADAGLHSVNSRIQDKMAGTQFSEENLAQDARERCTRSYNTKMRVLNNSY